MMNHAGSNQVIEQNKTYNLPWTWMACTAVIVWTLELLIPSGDQKEHWEHSFSAWEKGDALWITPRHWLVISDTHYTVLT